MASKPSAIWPWRKSTLTNEETVIYALQVESIGFMTDEIAETAGDCVS